MSETMLLVERHIIPRHDPRWKVLDRACFHAKNIYNAANYQRRQLFIRERKFISYEKQEKQFKQDNLLNDQKLPMKVVQQILRQIHDDWKGFFKGLRSYKQNPAKFRGRPRLPGYKDTTKGRARLVFTTQAISRSALRKGIITLSGLNVSISTRQKNINQVRVIPRANHCIIEVVYTKNIKPYDFEPDLCAGIDVGLNTLATLTSNKPGFRPLLVNGRPLKSINQRYNQLHAKWTSQLPEGQHTSHRLKAMTNKRNRRIDHQLHLASRYVIELLKRERIGILIIGKNESWKQEINLGKRTNQHFVFIPHARFIQMLQYKAQQVGIKVVLNEESYTSKCSFLDNEPICKHDIYIGKRVKRGLFKAGDGTPINADLNGAYNIIRKVYPDAFRKLTGVALHGERVSSKVIETHLRRWEVSHNGSRGAKRLNRISSVPVLAQTSTNQTIS